MRMSPCITVSPPTTSSATETLTVPSLLEHPDPPVSKADHLVFLYRELESKGRSCSNWQLHLDDPRRVARGIGAQEPDGGPHACFQSNPREPGKQ